MCSTSSLSLAQEMEAEVQRFYAKLEVQGIPQRYTHRQAGDLQWEYNDWLADACGPGEAREDGKGALCCQWGLQCCQLRWCM